MKPRQRAVYLFVLLLTILLVAAGIYTNANQQEYIRFHIVANSDSPEDQALKLRVRDRLLERFAQEFGSIDSIEAGREKIRNSIEEIQQIAFMEIEQAGKSYPVKVEFGWFSFPTRAYGHLVLPAGEYEALKVVIGEGKGSNWWCVMFPPLCFIDISHGVARQNEKATEADVALQAGMDINQPKRKTAAGNDEVEIWAKWGEKEDFAGPGKIEYRWKLAEWLRLSEVKLKRMFSFLSFWDR